MDNNPQPQPQRMSELLSQVATIASVRTTALGLTRTDKSASYDTERDHHALPGIARVSVSRLAGAEQKVRDIRAAQVQARECLNRLTTAWGEGGRQRLLPNTNIEKFLKEWSPVKDGFDRLVGDLNNAAPDLIAQAEANLGSFDVAPPTVEEIRDAFSLDFDLVPIPDSASYTSSNLDERLEEVLRERFEAHVSAAYQQAQSDALQRVAVPLGNLVERMTAYDKREVEKAKGIDVGREGVFRDAWSATSRRLRSRLTAST